jgi:hypothetical protein
VLVQAQPGQATPENMRVVHDLVTRAPLGSNTYEIEGSPLASPRILQCLIGPCANAYGSGSRTGSPDGLRIAVASIGCPAYWAIRLFCSAVTRLSLQNVQFGP